MIPERYRADYTGEFVVLESRWQAGKKQQKREWVPNPIENHHISGRAAVIASSVDTWQFDYTRLQRHRGGLLGSKKLQTYGTSSISNDMRLDFTIEIDAKNLDCILESGYYENNIVYTTAKNCLYHPGFFYLIPLMPRMTNVALALYLAAFDGHKEIFMLGYNKEMSVESTDWVEQVAQVFAAYRGIQFHLVGIESNMPAQWLDHPNCKNIDYREFISYCDV